MLTVILKGRNEAVFRRRRDALVESWNTAAMQRAKDLPELEPLLKRIGGEPEEAQSDDEIEAFFDALVERGERRRAAEQAASGRELP
jgi:hypothetical protein